MKVAINGFGRIGRLVFRLMSEDPDFNIVAINDLTDAEQLAYLLKYDTAHGGYKRDSISFEGNQLIIDNKRITIYAEKDPHDLPWGELGVDLVFECTGVFTSKEKCMAHSEAGAKKVIISAPAKGEEPVKTIVYGVNHNILDGTEDVISAASCTTNCLAPVLKIINDNFKIQKGYMTTIHAYTNDQSVLDLAHKKGIGSRRGRAAAANIIPTSTGAASAIGLVLPELDGKMEGIAMRVPTITGSVIDLTLSLGQKVTKEEINKVFKDNANGVIKFTMDPIVSSDVITSNVGAIVDGLSTNVLETEFGQLIKIIAWYDNEMGYSAQMVRTAKHFIELM
ncbi:MAG: type I glyceraldehyde-3-phosphate dehydrogenase [Bacilli bacterium]|nr:type I glyceraldehyde-3-phosphate dehydrogenase [Bacilli bacterium]